MSTIEYTVVADLAEDGKSIEVHFDYDANLVRLIKDKIPGRRFVPPASGGPKWRVPLDTTTARLLRETFGEQLGLSQRMIEWGRTAFAKDKELRSLATADDAELTVLPTVRPQLAEYLRPYQRADAVMMSKANVICANQPGLGKTVETIAAIYERGNLADGSHLIVAPKTSLEVVWEKELEDWTDLPIIVMSGDLPKSERKELLELCQEFQREGQGFFLVLNPAFVRYDAVKGAKPVLKGGRLHKVMEPAYPELFEFEWTTLVFDEYHKMGLSNNKTNMFAAANDLKADHKILLSGTPMGGKPIKLWGALHFLYPEQFTSKWRWAGQWCDVEDNGYGKKIEGIQKGKEQKFWEHLQPFMVRRTKAEVLKELPPKQYIDVWCEMTKKQKKQYEAMAADAEIKIDEENLTATGVLAEYTRLKQFSDAHCTAQKFADGSWKVYPTFESGKLPHIMQILEERGITADADSREGNEQVVIASQFSAVVDMVHKYLNEMGIKAEKITGDVAGARRSELVREFQSGEVQVMIMTTTAGGVAITLDNASTMIIIDETWNPDDQEQMEDRIHRGSRIHQVTVYYLRSKGSIEERIQQIVMDKHRLNRDILDLRRQGLRAV